MNKFFSYMLETCNFKNSKNFLVAFKRWIWTLNKWQPWGFVYFISHTLNEETTKQFLKLKWCNCYIKIMIPKGINLFFIKLFLFLMNILIGVHNFLNRLLVLEGYIDTSSKFRSYFVPFRLNNGGGRKPK